MIGGREKKRGQRARKMAARRETKKNSSIVLISSDAKVFEVSAQDAKLSPTLVDKINRGVKEVKFKINGDLLTLIVVYLEIHKGIEPPPSCKPLQHTTMAKNCGEKNARYVDNIWDTNLYDIYDLLPVLEEFGIPSLFELFCAKIAHAIKGKSLIEARQIVRGPVEPSP